MLKRSFQVFIIAMCTLAFLSCLGCSSIAESEPISELNQAFKGSDFSIIADEIRATQGPSSDEIIVGVHLIVENLSNEDFLLGRVFMLI